MPARSRSSTSATLGLLAAGSEARLTLEAFFVSTFAGIESSDDLIGAGLGFAGADKAVAMGFFCFGGAGGPVTFFEGAGFDLDATPVVVPDFTGMLRLESGAGGAVRLGCNATTAMIRWEG